MYVLLAKAAKIAAANIAAKELFHNSEVDELKRKIMTLESQLQNQVYKKLYNYT